jgi:threonylcarbamoyladenosine tRNA methylthiotransferase MtaB
MNSVAFYTLGCKLNQTESEGIADAFRLAGFSVVKPSENPDIIIVNTCAVTSKAEQKARRMIRYFLKTEKKVKLIVSGCYAELNKTEIAALDKKRLFVVKGSSKAELLLLPRKLQNGISIENALPDDLNSGNAERTTDTFGFNPSLFSFHSRASLKIQDGCNRACTYCAVHIARGKSVSLASSEILSRLRKIEDSGIDEAVLTGVNICQYNDGNLAELLCQLIDGTKRIKLRLSSLEPDYFFCNDNIDFFKALSSDRIRPHFHISVQSASESILRSMGRCYSKEQLLQIIAKLRSVRDNPFISCDIITGFPGESDANFEETEKFCVEAQFAWIHAFPFSPRPGTKAFDFPSKVSERDAVRRVERLIQLAKQGQVDYNNSWIGKSVFAIREGDNGDSFNALSENYLKLIIAKKGKMPDNGKEFRCKITDFRECAIGEIVYD